MSQSQEREEPKPSRTGESLSESATQKMRAEGTSESEQSLSKVAQALREAQALLGIQDLPDPEQKKKVVTNVVQDVPQEVKPDLAKAALDQLDPEQKKELMKTVIPEPRTAAYPNGTRYRNVISLTLIGVIAIVLIFATTILALAILPSVAVAIVAFAGGVVATIGTFIGAQTGYLLGSSGKEHAQQQADTSQRNLVDILQSMLKRSN